MGQTSSYSMEHHMNGKPWVAHTVFKICCSCSLFWHGVHTTTANNNTNKYKQQQTTIAMALTIKLNLNPKLKP